MLAPITHSPFISLAKTVYFMWCAKSSACCIHLVNGKVLYMECCQILIPLFINSFAVCSIFFVSLNPCLTPLFLAFCCQFVPYIWWKWSWGTCRSCPFIERWIEFDVWPLLLKTPISFYRTFCKLSLPKHFLLFFPSLAITDSLHGRLGDPSGMVKWAVQEW